MRVLLMSATSLECRPCFAWLDENPGLPVDQLITGVGQLSAAVALQKQVLLSRPDLIVQGGIAGAAAPGDTGHVFAIDKEILADLGAEEPGGFRDIFDLRLAERDASPFCGGELLNPHKELFKLAALPTRTGLTVNCISTDKSLLQIRKQNHPLFVETMEGAALHYVALREKIPFLQIRAVSNEAGERDKTRWLLRESIVALNACLKQLIQKLVNSDETYFRI